MAARDVLICGNTYEGVQKIHLVDGNGDVHTYVEISDTTATTNHIMNGTDFYDANGVKHTGKGTMISKVVTQDTHGGDIVTYAGDWLSEFNWIGLDAELLEEYTFGRTSLDKTSFNGWTPSTTAKTIQATKNLSTHAANLNNYEYWLLWYLDTHTNYAAGTTIKGGVIHQTIGLLQSICLRPSNLANVQSETDNNVVCNSLFSASSIMDYYDTSNARKFGYTGSYGIYGEVTAATFSSTSSKTPTITIKAPIYRARCSTTYFTTTMANAVDQTTSTIDCHGWFFRTKANSGVYYNQYHNLVKVFNNGVMAWL